MKNQTYKKSGSVDLSLLKMISRYDVNYGKEFCNGTTMF